MYYIKGKDETITEFINNLPNILQNGWNMCDENKYTDEDFHQKLFVCEYVGDELKNADLFIYLTDIDGYKFSLRVFPNGTNISEDEARKIIEHFFSFGFKKSSLTYDVTLCEIPN